jgi:hypothetical protein
LKEGFGTLFCNIKIFLFSILATKNTNTRIWIQIFWLKSDVLTLERPWFSYLLIFSFFFSNFLIIKREFKKFLFIDWIHCMYHNCNVSDFKKWYFYLFPSSQSDFGVGKLLFENFFMNLIFSIPVIHKMNLYRCISSKHIYLFLFGVPIISISFIKL